MNFAEETSKNLQRTVAREMEDIVEEDGFLDIFDFPDLIEDYLVELEIRNYSRNTIKTYKSIITSFHRFLAEEKPEDEKEVLRAFKKYIQYLKRKKNVSQNYIYVVTIVIKKFFEFSDIDILAQIKTPKRTKSLPKSLSEDEVKSLIDVVGHSAAEDPPYSNSKIITLRNKAILTLLYSSGLRISELVSLDIDDVDLEDRTIRVRGKGEKDRIVLFNEEAKALLEEYLDERLDGGNALFVNKFRTHMTPRYVQMMIKKYAELAGIKKKVTPHILRHSFATHLLKNGVDIRAIQQLLGHANLNTTQIYTSVDMQTLRSAYDRANLL